MQGTRARLAFLLLALCGGVALALWLGGAVGQPAVGDLGGDEASGSSAPRAAAGLGSDEGGLEAAPSAGRASSPRGAERAPAAAAAGTADEPEEAEGRGPFRGVCVDESGGPVARATVTVVAGVRTKGGGVEPSAFAPVTSAEDGTFELPGPVGIRSIRVRATAEGRAPLRGDEELTRTAVGRCVLVSACELRVRVVAEEGGAAVPGAKVFAYGGRSFSIEHTPDLARWVALDEGVTDAEGRARLRTPGGPAGLLVRPRLHAPVWAREFRVPSAGLDVEIVVPEGGSVRGRVVDPEGRGIAGARVLAKAPLDWAADLFADGEGRFTLTHLPAPLPSQGGRPFSVADQLRVAAYVPGHPRASAFTGLPANGATAETELLLMVLPYVRLEGTLVRADGSPVVGATILPGRFLEVFGVDLPHGLDPAGADGVVTDATGAFLLERYGPEEGAAAWIGTPGALSGYAGDISIARADAAGPHRIVGGQFFLPWDRERPVFAADRPGERRVRVVDAAGAPLEGASLEAGVVRMRFDLVDRARTDAEGRATLRHLPAGRVTVVVHPPSGPSFDALVDVGTAASEEVVIAQPSGVVAGHVTRLDGSPARLSLRVLRILRSSDRVAAELGSGTASTDEAGAFRCTGLGGGEYELLPDASFELQSGPRYVFAGDADLRYVATTPGETTALHLEVALVDSIEGKPLVPQVARATLSGMGLAPADAGRTWSLYPAPPDAILRSRDPLPPGTWDVTVTVEGWAGATARSVRVPDGGRSPRLALRLEPSGRIEGVVVDAAGHPAPGPVTVWGAGRSATVHEDGTFVLGGPMDGVGPVDLDAVGELIAFEGLRVPLTGGRVTGVRLVVATRGAVRLVLGEGRRPSRAVVAHLSPVVDTGGAAPADALIGREALRTGASTCTLPSLVAGVYRLTGTWDDRPLPEREVVVRAGETAVVELREP